jgi:hypothetical protein
MCLYLLRIGLVGLYAANVFVIVLTICLALRHNLVRQTILKFRFKNVLLLFTSIIHPSAAQLRGGVMQLDAVPVRRDGGAINPHLGRIQVR